MRKLVTELQLKLLKEFFEERIYTYVETRNCQHRFLEINTHNKNTKFKIFCDKIGVEYLYKGGDNYKIPLNKDSSYGEFGHQ